MELKLVIPQKLEKKNLLYVLKILLMDIFNNQENKFAKRYSMFYDYITNTLELDLNGNSIRDILIFAIESFSLTKVQNLYVLRLDKDILIPNTKLKLNEVVSLIEFGNTDIKGINFFINAFNTIKNDIPLIVRLYNLNSFRGWK